MSGWKQGVQYGENLKKDQQGEVDGRKEITYKLLGTDEGGNDCDVTEDCQEMGYE